MKDVMFSSKSDLWETPQAFFDELNREFCFKTDVCALPENAKCDAFYTPEQDGLSQEWTGVCWCNPPYGRKIGEWVRKAAESEATVVMLLPARTDTKWFHDYILPNAEIRFIKGRLKFGGGQKQCSVPVHDLCFQKRGVGTNMENDLIRRSDLLAKKCMVRGNLDHGSTCPTKITAIPLDVIKRAPAVDAVEVVRCCDCEHWDSGKSEPDSWEFCCFHYIGTGSEDFCSCGKRKEGGGK